MRKTKSKFKIIINIMGILNMSCLPATLKNNSHSQCVRVRRLLLGDQPQLLALQAKVRTRSCSKLRAAYETARRTE